MGAARAVEGGCEMVDQLEWECVEDGFEGYGLWSASVDVGEWPWLVAVLARTEDGRVEALLVIEDDVGALVLGRWSTLERAKQAASAVQSKLQARGLGDRYMAWRDDFDRITKLRFTIEVESVDAAAVDPLVEAQDVTGEMIEV